MSQLESRRKKVEWLTEQALMDGQPHKFIQGRYILKEIEKRMNYTYLNRINYLNQIRK